MKTFCLSGKYAENLEFRDDGREVEIELSDAYDTVGYTLTREEACQLHEWITNWIKKNTNAKEKNG